MRCNPPTHPCWSIILSLRISALPLHCGYFWSATDNNILLSEPCFFVGEELFFFWACMEAVLLFIWTVLLMIPIGPPHLCEWPLHLLSSGSTSCIWEAALEMLWSNFLWLQSISGDGLCGSVVAHRLCRKKGWDLIQSSRWLERSVGAAGQNNLCAATWAKSVESSFLCSTPCWCQV